MRIELYQRRVEPARAAELPVPTAGQAERQAGAMFANAAGDVAQGLGALALGQTVAEEEAARAWTAQQLADARVEWQRREAQAREQAPPDFAGHAQRLASDFDTWRAEVEKQAPTEGARRLLGERLTLLRGHLLADAEEAERVGRVETTVTRMQDSLSQLGSVVTANPAALPQVLNDVNAVLDAGQLPPQVRERLRRSAVEELTRATATALIGRDPSAAMQLLGSEEWQLDPGDRARLLAAARGEVEQRQRQARAEAEARAREARYEAQVELGQRLDEQQAQLAAGIVPRELLTAEDFRRAYGERWRPRFDAYQARVAQTRQLSEFAGLPLPEQRAAYERARQQAEQTGKGAELLPAMERVLGASTERVAADPAGVVMGRLGPRVLGGPAAVAIRAAWDAQGASLGVPEHLRKALPEDVVRDLGARWQAADARGKVELLTPLFSGLEGHPARPALVRQLEKAGIPAGAAWVARAAERGDVRDAEMLAEIIDAKLPAPDKDTRTEIKDALAAQDDDTTRAARAKANAAGPGAMAALARQQELQERIVQALVARGASVREAIKRSREMLVGRGGGLYSEGLAAIERLPDGLDANVVERALDKRREELRRGMTLDQAARLGFVRLEDQPGARALQEKTWRKQWHALLDTSQWQDAPDGSLWLTLLMPDGRRVRIDDPRFHVPTPLLLVNPAGGGQ